MSTIWADVPLEGSIGGVLHIRIPIRVVIVTPEQAVLGLGA